MKYRILSNVKRLLLKLASNELSAPVRIQKCIAYTAENAYKQHHACLEATNVRLTLFRYVNAGGFNPANIEMYAYNKILNDKDYVIIFSIRLTVVEETTKLLSYLIDRIRTDLNFTDRLAILLEDEQILKARKEALYESIRFDKVRECPHKRGEQLYHPADDHTHYESYILADIAVDSDTLAYIYTFKLSEYDRNDTEFAIVEPSDYLTWRFSRKNETTLVLVIPHPSIDICETNS